MTIKVLINEGEFEMKTAGLILLSVVCFSGSAFAQSNAAIRQQQTIVKKDFELMKSTRDMGKTLTNNLHSDQAKAAKGDQKAAARLSNDVKALAAGNEMYKTEQKMMQKDVDKLGKMTTPPKPVVTGKK